VFFRWAECGVATVWNVNATIIIKAGKHVAHVLLKSCSKVSVRLYVKNMSIRCKLVKKHDSIFYQLDYVSIVSVIVHDSISNTTASRVYIVDA